MKPIIFLPLVMSALVVGAIDGKDIAKTTFDGRFNSRCNPWLRDSHLEMCEVSFYRLLATPEKYDGRIITVTGFLVRVFGRPVLFPDRQSYDADLQYEGVELVGKFDVDSKLAHNISEGIFPVTVVGRFDARYEGPDVERLGGICNIYSVEIRNKIPEH
jgi:hypothetical protein